MGRYGLLLYIIIYDHYPRVYLCLPIAGGSTPHISPPRRSHGAPLASADRVRAGIRPGDGAARGRQVEDGEPPWIDMTTLMNHMSYQLSYPPLFIGFYMILYDFICFNHFNLFLHETEVIILSMTHNRKGRAKKPARNKHFAGYAEVNATTDRRSFWQLTCRVISSCQEAND